LATYRVRLPPWPEVMLVFAVCAVLVYSLALAYAFYTLPSWLLSLRTEEWLELLSYILLVAFMESSVQCLGWVALYAVLPARWFREHFVSQSSVATLVLAIPFLGLRRYPRLLLDTELALLLGGLCLTIIAAFWIRVSRFEPLRRVVTSIAERLSVLLYLYIPATALGVVFIAIQAFLP
jgi:hypothetical protein